jgi:hypothetical protein
VVDRHSRRLRVDFVASKFYGNVGGLPISQMK